MKSYGLQAWIRVPVIILVTVLGCIVLGFGVSGCCAIALAFMQMQNRSGQGAILLFPVLTFIVGCCLSLIFGTIFGLRIAKTINQSDLNQKREVRFLIFSLSCFFPWFVFTAIGVGLTYPFEGYDLTADIFLAIRKTPPMMLFTPLGWACGTVSLGFSWLTFYQTVKKTESYVKLAEITDDSADE